MMKYLLAGLTAAAAIGIASPASAQATRTWVSGVGDDVNPCSRTAPCKTFAGAISKTAAGGEINCLDPGGYGAVTIVKSMTISCPYTEGGALAGGNGITVNLPSATDSVFIRGLDIFGVNPPSHGIRFVGQGSLHVQDVVIRRFNSATSAGISFQPAGPSRLYVTRSTIADNTNGIDIRAAEGNGADVFIVDSSVANNRSGGIAANGAEAVVRVGNSLIAGNGTGIAAGTGGRILSYGDNRLDGNATDGSFTGTAARK